eukprot:403340262
MKYEESMKHKMMYRSHKSCIVTSKQFATEENFIELAKIHGKSFTQQSSQNFSDSKYILEKSSSSEEFYLNPYLGQNKRGRPKKKLIVKPVQANNEQQQRQIFLINNQRQIQKNEDLNNVLRKYSAISPHPTTRMMTRLLLSLKPKILDFSKIPSYFYR